MSPVEPETAGDVHQGTLVLVVGPSGVGKDTLIDYCRERFADEPRVVFPRRTVTRAAGDASEDHDAVTPDAFAAAVASGAFALHWGAHGLHYGIPCSVETDLAAGRSVVANVSRTVIDEARRRFRPMLVVSTTAPRDILAKRLSGRARESVDEVNRRLDRAGLVELAGPDVVAIDNSGPAEIAGAALYALIRATLIAK